MKFGKFIMNANHANVDNKKSFLSNQQRDKSMYFEFSRRTTDLYDNGGLVAFREKFTVLPNVKSVKLTATALGVFEVYINGVRVGNDEMKPGWTDYRKTVFEFEYDVTELCRTSGENILVACVAPGWYSGRIARRIYGDRGCAFCGEITVIDNVGNTQIFATDESWETAYGGRVRTGEIWDGELYDAREKYIYSESDIHAPFLLDFSRCDHKSQKIAK